MLIPHCHVMPVMNVIGIFSWRTIIVKAKCLMLGPNLYQTPKGGSRLLASARLKWRHLTLTTSWAVLSSDKNTFILWAAGQKLDVLQCSTIIFKNIQRILRLKTLSSYFTIMLIQQHKYDFYVGCNIKAAVLRFLWHPDSFYTRKEWLPGFTLFIFYNHVTEFFSLIKWNSTSTWSFGSLNRFDINQPHLPSLTRLHH